MKLKPIKDVVERFLNNVPHLRDDDFRLIATIHEKEVKEIKPEAVDLHKISAYEYLLRFSQGQFTSPEAICRCRRKLQELQTRLRGKKYHQRHAEAEEIKKEFKMFEKPINYV